MRTHRRDSVHALAVTSAEVFKVAVDGSIVSTNYDGRYQVQGKGKK